MPRPGYSLTSIPLPNCDRRHRTALDPLLLPARCTDQRPCPQNESIKCMLSLLDYYEPNPRLVKTLSLLYRFLCRSDGQQSYFRERPPVPRYRRYHDRFSCVGIRQCQSLVFIRVVRDDRRSENIEGPSQEHIVCRRLYYVNLQV